MLVLSRKSGETIRIGDQVQVQVLEIQRGKVRIGLTAPANVTIHRQEIYDRICRGRGEGLSEERGKLT